MLSGSRAPVDTPAPGNTIQRADTKQRPRECRAVSLCARPRYILYSYLLALVVSTGCTVGVGLIALVVLLHLSCHDPLDLPGPMPWAFVLFETRPDLHCQTLHLPRWRYPVSPRPVRMTRAHAPVGRGYHRAHGRETPGPPARRRPAGPHGGRGRRPGRVRAEKRNACQSETSGPARQFAAAKPSP